MGTFACRANEPGVETGKSHTKREGDGEAHTQAKPMTAIHKDKHAS